MKVVRTLKHAMKKLVDLSKMYAVLFYYIYFIKTTQTEVKKILYCEMLTTLLYIIVYRLLIVYKYTPHQNVAAKSQEYTILVLVLS